MSTPAFWSAGTTLSGVPFDQTDACTVSSGSRTCALCEALSSAGVRRDRERADRAAGKGAHRADHVDRHGHTLHRHRVHRFGASAVTIHGQRCRRGGRELREQLRRVSGPRRSASAGRTAARPGRRRARRAVGRSTCSPRPTRARTRSSSRGTGSCAASPRTAGRSPRRRSRWRVGLLVVVCVSDVASVSA